MSNATLICKCQQNNVRFPFPTTIRSLSRLLVHATLQVMLVFFIYKKNIQALLMTFLIEKIKRIEVKSI